VTPTGEIVNADRLPPLPSTPRIEAALKQEQANAQRQGRLLLWLAGACFTLAIAAMGLIWAIR
jgi:hypothetical protein